MGKYNGSKCLSCGIMFNDIDDVVVCPECGTPYHRDCYEREGKCINKELHENGGTWKPEPRPFVNSDGEPIRCARCGQSNPPEGLFCNRCGMPLNNSFTGEPRPFNDHPAYGQGSAQGNAQNSSQQGGYGQNRAGAFGAYANPNAMRFDQDSDIDGVKLGDYARYVGKNQFSYLASFIRFGKFGGKISLNFSALLFPQFYFFYRKMTFIGIIYLVLSVALSLPTIMLLSAAGYLPSISFVTESFVKSANFTMIRNLTSTGLMALQCVSAVFANYWYYRIARKNIQAVRNSDVQDEEAVKTEIARKGGVSMAAFLLAVLVSNALVVGAVFVMSKVG